MTGGAARLDGNGIIVFLTMTRGNISDGNVATYRHHTDNQARIAHHVAGFRFWTLCPETTSPSASETHSASWSARWVRAFSFLNTVCMFQSGHGVQIESKREDGKGHRLDTVSTFFILATVWLKKL